MTLTDRPAPFAAINDVIARLQSWPASRSLTTACHRGSPSSPATSPGDPRSTLDWAALARGGTTLVVLMGVLTLPDITKALLDAGMAADTPLACVMDAGMPSQRTVSSTVAAVATSGAPEGLRAPAVTVIDAAFAR